MSNTWRYIKGSEADFKGAPDWAMVKGSVVKLEETHIAWEGDGVYQYLNSRYNTEKMKGKFMEWNWGNKPTLIAQRERVPAPQWHYIKGGEADFIGAPDWADRIIKIDGLPMRYADKRIYENEDGTFRYTMSDGWTLIARRERVTDGLANIAERSARKTAAVATLERKGYTWCGGEEWKPPLGKPPAYITDDTVNHPSHYTQGGIECIDAIQAATVGKTGIEAACVANIIKYLWCYELKNGVQDIEKAQWYLNKLLEVKR